MLFQQSQIVVTTSQRRRVVLGRHEQLTAALAEIQRQLTSDQCQEVLQLVEHAWVCAALCRSVEEQQEQVGLLPLLRVGWMLMPHTGVAAGGRTHGSRPID